MLIFLTESVLQNIHLHYSSILLNNNCSPFVDKSLILISSKNISNFRKNLSEYTGAVKIFCAVFKRNENIYACQFVAPPNVIKTELSFS